MRTQALTLVWQSPLQAEPSLQPHRNNSLFLSDTLSSAVRASVLDNDSQLGGWKRAREMAPWVEELALEA